MMRVRDMRNRRRKRDLLRLVLELARMSENCWRYLRMRWTTRPIRSLVLRIKGVFASRLTTVVCVYYTNDRWPDEAQHDASPAIVERRGASRNSKNVVSARLDDVMDEYHVDREGNTENRIEHSSPPALCSARHEDCVICIQYRSQIPHDACERTDNADSRSGNKLDFDIAKTDSIPPARQVVCRPEKCIDEVEKIAQDDPKDQGRRGQVAVLDMPDDGRDVEYKSNE